MTTETLIRMLIWCSVINYGILILWAILLVLPHAWMYRLWSRFFDISEADASRINFAALAFYKLAILLFNLVPLIALSIATH